MHRGPSVSLSEVCVVFVVPVRAGGDGAPWPECESE